MRGIDALLSSGITASTCTQPVKSVSARQIINSIAEFMRENPEPFAEFMRKHGFDPDKGDLMVIPSSERWRFQSVPKYVSFGPTPSVMLMRGAELQPAEPSPFRFYSSERYF